MRVISKSRLKRFWESPAGGHAEQPLLAWYAHVNNKSVAWQNWSDVSASFGNADLVGNCVVFNIGGNKYRLIARILYPSQKVFILRVMTHKEYDKNKWKKECGCFNAPPKRRYKKKTVKKAVGKKVAKNRKKK